MPSMTVRLLGSNGYGAAAALSGEGTWTNTEVTSGGGTWVALQLTPPLGTPLHGTHISLSVTPTNPAGSFPTACIVAVLPPDRTERAPPSVLATVEGAVVREWALLPSRGSADRTCATVIPLRVVAGVAQVYDATQIVVRLFFLGCADASHTHRIQKWSVALIGDETERRGGNAQDATVLSTEMEPSDFSPSVLPSSRAVGPREISVGPPTREVDTTVEITTSPCVSYRPRKGGVVGGAAFDEPSALSPTSVETSCELVVVDATPTRPPTPKKSAREKFGADATVDVSASTASVAHAAADRKSRGGSEDDGDDRRWSQATRPRLAISTESAVRRLNPTWETERADMKPKVAVDPRALEPLPSKFLFDVVAGVPMEVDPRATMEEDAPEEAHRWAVGVGLMASVRDVLGTDFSTNARAGGQSQSRRTSASAQSSSGGVFKELKDCPMPSQMMAVSVNDVNVLAAVEPTLQTDSEVPIAPREAKSGKTTQREGASARSDAERIAPPSHKAALKSGPAIGATFSSVRLPCTDTLPLKSVHEKKTTHAREYSPLEYVPHPPTFRETTNATTQEKSKFAKDRRDESPPPCDGGVGKRAERSVAEREGSVGSAMSVELRPASSRSCWCRKHHSTSTGVARRLLTLEWWGGSGVLVGSLRKDADAGRGGTFHVMRGAAVLRVGLAAYQSGRLHSTLLKSVQNGLVLALRDETAIFAVEVEQDEDTRELISLLRPYFQVVDGRRA